MSQQNWAELAKADILAVVNQVLREMVEWDAKQGFGARLAPDLPLTIAQNLGIKREFGTIIVLHLINRGFLTSNSQSFQLTVEGIAEAQRLNNPTGGGAVIL